MDREESAQMPYVMSWERFAEERGKKLGLEIGEKRGEKRGEKQGEANALLLVFAAKFGPPGSEVEARVRAAPVKQIQQWLTRILMVDRPEDLFQD